MQKTNSHILDGAIISYNEINNKLDMSVNKGVDKYASSISLDELQQVNPKLKSIDHVIDLLNKAFINQDKNLSCQTILASFEIKLSFIDAYLENENVIIKMTLPIIALSKDDIIKSLQMQNNELHKILNDDFHEYKKDFKFYEAHTNQRNFDVQEFMKNPSGGFSQLISMTKYNNMADKMWGMVLGESNKQVLSFTIKKFQHILSFNILIYCNVTATKTYGPKFPKEYVGKQYDETTIHKIINIDLCEKYNIEQNDKIMILLDRENDRIGFQHNNKLIKWKDCALTPNKKKIKIYDIINMQEYSQFMPSIVIFRQDNDPKMCMVETNGELRDYTHRLSKKISYDMLSENVNVFPETQRISYLNNDVIYKTSSLMALVYINSNETGEVFIDI